MHGQLYNEVTLELLLRPQTPLLIKSGRATGIDPTLPDMQFVRTHRPTENGETEDLIYIPGSSLRGVLRSHAERLVRSINEDEACHVITKSCLPKQNLEGAKLSGEDAYKKSCFTCRLFGNTGIASRAKVGDFYPTGRLLTEVRPGVAIDRVTSAVAQGPFQMEMVTDGEFLGVITLRNFTLGQIGLLAAGLLDIADGLVPLGHAKSRGLGRMALTVKQAIFRFPRLFGNPEGKVKGIGALVDDGMRDKYFLPSANEDLLVINTQTSKEERGFFVLTMQGEAAKDWLEEVVPYWPRELGS